MLQLMLLTWHPSVSQVQRYLRFAVEKWKLSVCLARVCLVDVTYTIV